MENQDLLKLAKLTSYNAYAPYSKFKVGAVVLTKGGRVFTGCNVENASYGATCCAERVALFKAIAEGERNFTSIAVYGGDGEACVPCGICLQVIAELAPNADIVLSDGVVKINELLTRTFKLEENDDRK